MHTAGTWPSRATKRNGGGRSGGTSGTGTSGSGVGGGSRVGDQSFRRCCCLRRRRRTGTLTRGAERLLGNYTHTRRNNPTSQTTKKQTNGTRAKLMQTQLKETETRKV